MRKFFTIENRIGRPWLLRAKVADRIGFFLLHPRSLFSPLLFLRFLPTFSLNQSELGPCFHQIHHASDAPYVHPLDIRTLRAPSFFFTDYWHLSSLCTVNSLPPVFSLPRLKRPWDPVCLAPSVLSIPRYLLRAHSLIIYMHQHITSYSASSSSRSHRKEGEAVRAKRKKKKERR